MVSYLTLLMIALIVAFFWISSGLFRATRDEEAQAISANIAAPATEPGASPEPVIVSLHETDGRRGRKARAEHVGVLESVVAWFALLLIAWSRKLRHSTPATSASASATPQAGAGR